jgi:hypothetical protein
MVGLITVAVVIVLQNPNLEHMLQTAESIRAAGHPEWFQVQPRALPSPSYFTRCPFTTTGEFICCPPLWFLLSHWHQLVGLLHDMGKIMFLWGDKACGQEVCREHSSCFADAFLSARVFHVMRNTGCTTALAVCPYKPGRC